MSKRHHRGCPSTLCSILSFAAHIYSPAHWYRCRLRLITSRTSWDVAPSPLGLLRQLFRNYLCCLMFFFIQDGADPKVRECYAAM